MPNWKSYESSVRLLSAILAAHPELRLNYGEIAKCFGGDCTTSALENRFRRIKTDAKCIKEALAKGVDPITLAIEGGRVEKEVAKFYGDCTASSLDHRFRPIKKEAQKMREEMGGAIADKYGEGTTAKAVSTRFERLKKEPSWLTNGISGNNGTPPKVRANNGVRRAKNTAASGEQVNSDDEEVPVTPTKKTPKKEPINRTQAGRVTKARTQQKASQSIYVESDNEDDDIIKTETNGGVYNYGDGIDVEAGPFYDADDADEA